MPKLTIKESQKFQSIMTELQKMVKQDQTMRNRYTENPNEWDDSIAYQNIAKLKVIIEKIGWPSISKVGHSGSYNAWLLVQHADHDPNFQKKCLELMKAEPNGEVSKKDIAYLEDRIAVGDGRNQIYGTQFHKNTNGKVKPFPIKDPDNVNNFRKNIGLETLKENQKHIQERYDKK